jgi:hypothetical protein
MEEADSKIPSSDEDENGSADDEADANEASEADSDKDVPASPK